MGSGSDALYDGSSLARNGDIIVVTCNYRLGPLGFLDLAILDNDSLKFDVNLGLRDQVAALKWIKENISAFGGDPDNITIGGESAGGTSVLALVTTPYAKGLFQRAIVESASAKGASDKNDLTSITREYLRILGVSADNTSKLYTLPVDSFFAATRELASRNHWSLRDFGIFSPVSGDDFLPVTIQEAIENGAAKNISIIIGTNKDECNLFALLRGNKPTQGKTIRFLALHGFKDPSLITSLYPAYPSRQAMLSILTDGQFRIPSIHIAEERAAIAPLYMYRFDWTSSTLRSFRLYACHGIELPFVFDSFHSGLGKLVKSGASHRKVKVLSENIQASWINFIKSGNPSTSSYEWPKYDTAKRYTLLLDNKIQVVSDPDGAARIAWGKGH
jgi:para-nitrobenzyl esterase